MSKPKILEIEEIAKNVIEQGNNSNGNYIKFADGTLLQYGSNKGVDNSYRLVTFPINFVAKPRSILANTSVVDTNYLHLVQVSNIGTDNFRAYVRFQSASGGAWAIGANDFNWLAIGSWK